MAKRKLKIEDPVQEEIVEKVVEETTLPEPAFVERQGIVSGCAKLNIRKTASKEGNIVAVVDAKSKLTVTKVTGEWLQVITAKGVKGYCMKQFVTII